MDEKDKDKIVELKQKADDKRFHIRGLPREVGEKNETVNEVNRAFVQDEMIRANAQRQATDYLNSLEEEDEKFPNWMWFTTGMLFVIVIEVFFLHTSILDPVIKFIYGG